MKKKKTLLFNPGPTNVSESVRNAIKTEDICHREKEFSEVLSRVRNNILKVANGEKTHTAIVFVSSATGCNEAVISSIWGKILLIINGKYSERLKEIALRYKIPLVSLNFDPYNQIDLNKIETALKEKPDVTHIALVHHETTTGLLAPLHEIGQLAKKYRKVLFVDAVSSYGGHKIDLKADNISFCTVNANKCLQSFPGISFVIAKKSELEKLKGKSRSYYFDLYRQWEFEEKRGQLPFTPAVQLFFALDKALEELLREGVENRIKRYQRNAKLMRMGLKKLGFKLVVPEKFQGNIVTALFLAKRMNYWVLHDKLKKKGYTIYTGKETLKKGIFRISTLGCLKEKHIKQFLKDFENILKGLGFNPKNLYE